MTATTTFRCRICGCGEHSKIWMAQEKMFGWGGTFEYFECGKCGCLQICDRPADLDRFYPTDYYSFGEKPYPRDGLRRWIAGRRDRYAATQQGLFGRLMAAFKAPRTDVASLGAVPAALDSKILDVGCGSGQLLSILYRAGFRQVSGIDPFLADDIEVLPGLWVRKKHLTEVEGTFDVIMFHHVFEHLEDPGKMLRDCSLKLSPGGRVILRFPTADSDAWRRYRTDWVQLDAPRHLFLHTRASLEILAHDAGLEIDRLWHDSTEFQFIGSELYRRGIPLFGKKKPYVFSARERRSYSAAARRLNRLGRGDQVAVVLRKVSPSQ